MARRLALLLLPLLAAAAVARAQAPSCHTYTSKGLIQPAIASLQDVIVVQDAFVVGDASVTLDVSHRRVGALKITLAAAPFSAIGQQAGNSPTIILKSHGLGRLGDNLYRTTFSDSAPTSFPVNASFAPFTGTYRPTQKLAFLTDGETPVAGTGGSQGLWTLTVADVAPNNTRRDIALNGWTLVLCERGAAATPSPSPIPSPTPSPVPSAIPSPSPSPSPSPAQPAPATAPSPAPAVTGFDGPSDASAGTGTGTATNPTTQDRSWMGWKVVYRNQAGQQASTQQTTTTGSATGTATGTAGTTTGSAGTATGPATPLLQQLMGQQQQQPGPVLALLQQQITSIAAPALGGACDEACVQARQNLWRAALVGVYLKSLAEAHGVVKADLGHWMQKLQDWLPGENSKLQQLQGWLESHSGEVQKLGAWLHEKLPLPQLGDKLGGKLGDKLGQLGDKLGGGAKLQQLLDGGKLELPQLGGGEQLAGLMSSFAAGGDRMQQLVGNMAGGLDNAGENVHAFLSGMEGDTMSEVASQLMGLLDPRAFMDALAGRN